MIFINFYKILLILIIVLVVFRFYFYKKLIGRPIKFYSDEAAHLAFEKIRFKLISEPKILEKLFIFSKYLDYPTFYHGLLNFFSKNFEINFRRSVAFFLSFFQPIIFLIFFHSEFNYFTNLYVIAYLLGSLLFFGVSGIYSISYTPRLFADLLISTYTYLIIKYFLIGNITFLILASIPLIFILFTSKFGIQFVVFFSLTFFSLSFNIKIFIPLFLGVICSLLLNRKKFSSIITTLFYHQLWYFKNSDWITSKNKINFRDIKSIYYYLNSYPIFGMLIQFIPFFPLLIIFVLSGLPKSDLVYSLLSVFILSIITCIKPFISVGPSFRYSMPLIPVAIAVLLEQNFIEKYVSMIYLLFDLILSIIISFKYFDSKYLEDNIDKEYLKMLQSISIKNKTVLTSPIRISISHYGFKSDYNTRFYEFLSFDRKVVSNFNKYLEKYPFITNKVELLGDLINQHGFDYLIIDKILTENFFSDSEPYEKSMKKNKIIYDSERFKVYKIN